MPLKDVDIEETQGHAAAVEEFALTIAKTDSSSGAPAAFEHFSIFLLTYIRFCSISVRRRDFKTGHCNKNWTP